MPSGIAKRGSTGSTLGPALGSGPPVAAAPLDEAASRAAALRFLPPRSWAGRLTVSLIFVGSPLELWLKHSQATAS